MTKEPRLRVVGDSSSAPCELSPTWVAANRRVLAAEVRRFSSRLARFAGDALDPGAEAQRDEELTAARDGATSLSALDCLQRRFGLSSFEYDVIIACAAFALDPTLAVRYEPVTFSLVQALAMPADHTRGAVALVVELPMQNVSLVRSRRERMERMTTPERRHGQRGAWR